MEGKVKPVNVAPLIKCARYCFLILGYVYGSFRLSALRMYESKARVMRHKMLHDRAEREKLRGKEEATRDFTDIGKEFGVTDFPPGWDKDL